MHLAQQGIRGYPDRAAVLEMGGRDTADTDHMVTVRWTQDNGWHDARLMGYPASVAVTWETTFAQLTEPERRLLGVLAWLAVERPGNLAGESALGYRLFTTLVAVTVVGTGERRHSFVAMRDVAAFAMAALDSRQAENAVFSTMAHPA